MSAEYQEPQPGHYRLSHRVHIASQDRNTLAICDYPLRIVRLHPAVANVLTLCKEEHTPEQLSQATHMPLKRIERLCDQLRWNGLLDAGPLLPPLVWPPVSIVIPSYNRAKELERCLRSLFVLDYPADCLEIIVVDDASNNETGMMLQHLQLEATAYDLTLRTLRHEKQQGAGISRNSGTEIARYNLVAYIDSDCVASPGWLKELVPAFQDTKIGAVGGMIRAYDTKALLGRYEDVRSSLYMGVYAQQVRLKGPLTYLPAANLVVRQTVWQELTGFAPMTFGEDVDFCRRLLLSGANILYIAKGVVYHDYRTRLEDFLQIHVAYASTEAALLKRHPAERRILVLPPEQAIFAAFLIGGVWGILWLDIQSIWSSFQGKAFVIAMLPFLIVFLLSIFGIYNRLQKVQEYGSAIGIPIVMKATLRGHLAYTYHLSRHLTRYYTIPLFLASFLVPPLLILLFILCSIVIGVDYIRLKPEMDIGRYALCSLLDDCAYEVGVVWGCIKYETWKPLVPVIKASV
jgi:mycofactocin system glycosyltransferase